MPPQLPRWTALIALLLTACGTAQDVATPMKPTDAKASCLPDGSGFLRARLRGAIDADIDWRGAELSCEGGPRPDGSGSRLTIAGPLKGSQQVLRFVFGIDDAGSGGAGRNLATNITLIVEGAQALYATRGDDKCTTDRLQQSAADAARPRQQRIEAHGFCTGPAASIDGTTRVLVETFDFASLYTTEDPH